MPKYGLIACFSPVIKVDIGEHKFDGTGLAKIGKWNKIAVLVIQKVAKTGNIGKKLQWQAVLIMQDTSACRRLTWIKRDDAWTDARLKVNKH